MDWTCLSCLSSFSPLLRSLLSVPTKPVLHSVYSSFTELPWPPDSPGEFARFPIVSGPLWSDFACAPSPLHCHGVISRLLHYHGVNTHVTCLGRFMRKGQTPRWTTEGTRVLRHVPRTRKCGRPRVLTGERSSEEAPKCEFKQDSLVGGVEITSGITALGGGDGGTPEGMQTGSPPAAEASKGCRLCGSGTLGLAESHRETSTLHPKIKNKRASLVPAMGIREHAKGRWHPWDS